MRLSAFLLFIASFAAAPATLAAEHEVFVQLSSIGIDPAQVYSIRDITIRRDVFSISFNRGVLAFTTPVQGRVTGAVFIGSGDILATLPNPVERQQLHRFTGAALLSERFETAVLRFTDDTYDEILREYRTHAIEDVDPDAVNEILRWDSELQRRARFVSDRILADLLGNAERPFFLAQIEGGQLGWFDAIYDERRTEEVMIQQNVTSASDPVAWISFNKRSEVREPEAFAHEDKSVTEVIAYTHREAEGLLTLRANVDGERVLEFPTGPESKVLSIAAPDGQELPFHDRGDQVAVVLPAPTRRNQEIMLRITFAPDAAEPLPVRPNSAAAVAPASYRDQWIVEGLARYAALVSGGGLAQARDALLLESPHGGTYERAGPVSIGYRMTQPRTTEGSVQALTNKSVWIIHMLRMLMRQGSEDDTAFGLLIRDVTETYAGRRISTYDFMDLAERHAGKDLDWFFEQWVFGTGIPVYSMEYAVDPSGGRFTIAGRIEQSGLPESFTMPVPVYADDVLLGVVTVSSEEGSFRFVVDAPPNQVRLDPNGTVLAVVR